MVEVATLCISLYLGGKFSGSPGTSQLIGAWGLRKNSEEGVSMCVDMLAEILGLDFHHLHTV